MVKKDTAATSRRGRKSQEEASPAVADAPGCSLEPFGPKPSGAGKWKPIVATKTLSIKGGYASKSSVVESIEVGDEIFVKLEKNADWMLKLAGGPKAVKGGLSRTRVVEELRRRCGLECKPQAHSPSKSDAHECEDDPMQAVDECAYEGTVAETKPKRVYYTPKRMKDHVVTVDMPARALGRSGGETVQVKLLAKGTNSIWLHDAMLPWLLTFLADEHARCGVEVPAKNADENTLVANTSVPGLAIRWDFSSQDSWEAIWIDGPRKGEIVRSSISAMTEQKWLAIDGDKEYGTTFSKAPFAARKKAVMKFLEHHCSQLLPGTPVGEMPPASK